MYLSVLSDHASRQPDVVAAMTADRRVSYAELWADVCNRAAALREAGVAQGQVVGLTIRDEYLHFVCTLAVIRLGCVQVTLPTFETLAFRNSLAMRTGVGVLLVESPIFSLPGIAAIVAGELSCRSPEDLPASDPGRPCIHLVSSGTTGQPKIVSLSQTQLYLQSLGWKSPPRREVFWRPAPIEHNNSKRHRLYGVVAGSTNVFVDAGVDRIPDVIEAYGVTAVTLSVVEANGLTQLVERGSRGFPQGCEIWLAGSPASDALRRKLCERVTPRLHILYGATEVGSISCAGPGELLVEGSVGFPHSGVELQIVDDSGCQAARGEKGLVRIRASGMAAAYVGDDQATAKAFRDGWFYPGDVGQYLENGAFRLLGRADDMMILASINIFPSEIEAAFVGYAGVLDCAALALRSVHFGDVPLLAVVCDDGVDLQELSRFGRNRLGVRAPRKVFRVAELPRNSSGKVVKTELIRMFEKQRGDAS